MQDPNYQVIAQIDHLISLEKQTQVNNPKPQTVQDQQDEANINLLVNRMVKDMIK